MQTDNPQASPETHAGYWRRVLRPLFWWGILVLVLFAIHQHQLALERTRIYFSVTLQETNVLNDAVTLLDGQQIGSGDNISLGWHRFTITDPKTENYASNFFAWYGRHDFGKTNLKRGMGTLNVTAEPAANMIAISGPEYALTLSNSTGTSVLVPTDTYQVSARYARRSENRAYQVTAGNSILCAFAPHMGAISLSCNEAPAIYELLDGNRNLVEKGDMPATVTELPSARYEIRVVYHNYQIKREITVSDKETNDVPLHFTFGAARFESVPSGAQVYTTNGAFLGTTPVIVSEIPPSTADYRLQLNGYGTATVSVTVVENETNGASATLVSLSYVGSLRTAKQDMDSGNYKSALAALEEALTAKPGDTDALNLQTTAKGRELVQEAKVFAKQGDYIAAGKKLEAGLEILPDDAEAKELQANYKPHEAEQIGKVKQMQTHDLFDRVCKANHAGGLFETHEVLAAAKSPEDVRDAIVQNCETVAPTLKVRVNKLVEGMYEMIMVQASENPLVMSRRECLMVIGKGKEDQTLILFEVVEFQRKATGNLTEAVLGGNNANEWVPLDPSRQMTEAHSEQIRAGVRLMQKKVNDAIQ